MNVKIAKYQMFMMFQPEGEDTIRVPLSVINWGWSGIAESSDGGTNWTKTSGDPDAMNPDSMPSNTPPKWDQIVPTIIGEFPWRAP
jgi:hypothetical protein